VVLHFCVGTMNSVVHRYCCSVVFLALPHVTRRSPCGITSLLRNTWPCCDDVIPSYIARCCAATLAVLCLLQQSGPADHVPQPVHLAHEYWAADGPWFPPQVHAPIPLARALAPSCSVSCPHTTPCMCVCVLSPAHARAHSHRPFLSPHAYTFTQHTSAHPTHSSPLTRARAESLVALAGWCSAGSCTA
jgi:hypothetical protein